MAAPAEVGVAPPAFDPRRFRNARRRRAGHRFAHLQPATHELQAIGGFDGLDGLVANGHLDEPEAP